MPLDPANLTPTASLNRLRFIPLPGLLFPSDYLDKTAFDLLSAQAVAARVQQHAPILDLERTDPLDVLPTFDRCFLSDDPSVRYTTELIAQEVGQALGYLLLTLKQGDNVSRAIRPEWDDSYWAQWGQVNQVWLGGGLSRGTLGERMAEHARQFMQDANWTQYRVNVSPHKNLMSVVGLARQVPPGEPSALIFDAGGSTIKRTLARYHGTTLCDLLPLPSVPALCLGSSPDDLAQAARIFEHLLGVICSTYDTVPEKSVTTIGLSLACYLQQGQPFARGCYGSLRLLSDNLHQFLVTELSRRLKKTIRVILMHDGTAAAAAHAGIANAAILVLGTALGSGFPALETLPITAGNC
jgi:hypothetical protein